MRTFRSSLCVTALAAAVLALAVMPAGANAQRNVRRSTHRSASTTSNSPDRGQHVAAPRHSRACGDDCGGYTLAVVSAVLPSETAGVTSDVVTLVIENQGTSSAPASVITVAPKDRLTLARWSTIPALAPGQRATVQLPVEIGPDGTPCISITIATAPPVAAPATTFLASAVPDAIPSLALDDSWQAPDLWSAFPRFENPGFLGGVGETAGW